MRECKLVILMGGRASRLAPISNSLPKGLNFTNNKPAFFNNIDSLYRQGLKDICIVCNDSNIAIIKEMFDKAYGKFLNLEYVIQKNINGPLGALQSARKCINKPILLMLADTLCNCDFDLSNDFIGYSKDIDKENFQRWCYLDTDKDDKIIGFVDKPNTVPNTDKIVMGVYYLKNYKLLKKLLKDDYESLHNEKQLSSLFEEYLKIQPLYAQEIKDWQDIGTIKNFSDINRKYINGRYFNNFNFDGQTIKKSGSNEIIKHEIEWYKIISKTPLKKYIPCLYSYKLAKNNFLYEMEYLSGLTLSMYDTYFSIPLSTWEDILESLISTVNQLWSYPYRKNMIDIAKANKYMLIDKTIRRLDEWDNSLLKEQFIYLNGEKLLSGKILFDKLQPFIEKLIKNSATYLSVIHGDMNFSNIFYYPETTTFKFIDPRGKYYKVGILGDKRYDLAKIRHSYVYKHNKLTHNFFKLEIESKNKFNLMYEYNQDEDKLFDKIIKKYNFEPDEIKLIDGLLYLSQISLHKENEEFQIASYLIGIKILNDFLKK